MDKIKTIKESKRAKSAHAFKNYAHTYNVEVLNSFNPEVQVQNTEFAIKNKQSLLNELRGLRFVITLV